MVALLKGQERPPMKSTMIGALMICATTGLLAVRPQPAPPGSLLVLAKTDQTLSIVDPATLKVLGRVPSGPDPHEVVASSDGRVAFISNYNGRGKHIT